MFKKSFYQLFIIVSMSAFAGLSACSNGSETRTAKNDNANQTIKVITNSNSSNISAAPTAAPASPVNESVAPTNGSAKEDTKPPIPVKSSTPVQGSGGNDFLLFTQVRGALNADNEFVTAVIVNIKDGNVVLTGKVSSAAQKAKAEQIVKGVKDVKSVKNELKTQ